MVRDEGGRVLTGLLQGSCSAYSVPDPTPAPGSMPAGWLIDNVPGNPLLAAALLIQTIGYSIMPLCTRILQVGVMGSDYWTIEHLPCSPQAILCWQPTDPSASHFAAQLAITYACISFTFNIINTGEAHSTHTRNMTAANRPNQHALSIINVICTC